MRCLPRRSPPPMLRKLSIWKRLKTLVLILLGLGLSLFPYGLPLMGWQRPAPRLAWPMGSVIAVEAASSPAEQALELFWQGYQHFQANQPTAAIAPWQEALSLYQQAQDPRGERSVLSALGAAYLNLENYSGAIAHLERFLASVEGESDGTAPSQSEQLAQAQVLSNLGIAYGATGRYARAVMVQEEALALMQSLGSGYQGVTAQVWGNLGNAYATVGDYEAAIQAHQQSREILQQDGNPLGEAEALSNLGLLHANQGDYVTAIAQYQQSLLLLESLDDGPQVTQVQTHLLLNLASAHHAQQELDRAEVYYRQSLALAQRVGDRSIEGMSYGGLGMVQEDRGNLENAVTLQREGLAVVRTLGNPRLEATVLNNLGHTLFQQGEYQDAEVLLRAAIAHLESLRPGLADLDNVALFDSQVFSYSLLQQILVAQDQIAAALEVSEQGRARAFADLLARRADPGVQTQKPLEVLTAEQIQAIARRQNATLVEYAIVADDAFKFQGRQRGREAALFIWVVQPSGTIHFRQVDLQPLWAENEWAENEWAENVEENAQNISLASLVATSRRTLGVRGDGTVSTEATSFNWRKLQELHTYLIEPIADLLPTDPADPVILIPQDALFLVPFPALQAADGTFLLDSHTLLTAPSIQVIALAQNQQRRETLDIQEMLSSVLLVGNPRMPAVSYDPGEPPEPLSPLPGSEQEVRDIAHLLDLPFLLGEAATEVTVREKMPQARVIHLATHGLLNYGQTRQGRGRDMPGAIALTPQPVPTPPPDADGLLTTAEILTLRLDADLVVLSACNTGRGDVTGDGVIGLSRAFLSAGAASIIVSLWAVSDTSTAFVMTHFYENLQRGQGKAQALRQAMLDAKEAYGHPFDWAAFTIIGQAR